jgi:GntR family transcriptional regulator
VYCVRRLRCANDEPIGYHLAYVAPEAAEGIDEAALTTGGSLDYLRREGRIHGARAERILEAVPAGDTEMLLLGVEKGAPLLRIRRLLVAPDGRAVESLDAVYRGDRFQYRLGQKA